MKKILPTLIIALLAITLHAQNKDSLAAASGMSLKQAIDYTMKNQISVQNAEIDRQIAEAHKKEVIALGLPQISGFFDVKDFTDIPTTLIPASFVGGPPDQFIGLKFGTQYNGTAEADVSQMIFDGTFFLAVKAMKGFMELSDKAVTRTRIDAAAAVTKAYYNVLISEDRMHFLDDNIERLKKLQSDTKILFDNGFVEKIDLDRITVNYNNLMTEKDKTQRFFDLSYNLLKYQMGMSQHFTLKLTDNLSDISIPPDAMSTDKFDPTKRIEFSLLQTQQQMNVLELKKNRYGYLPSLNAYASGNEAAYRTTFNIFSPGGTWYPTSLVGIRLSLPIFDGGQKHYRVEQNKLNILKTDNAMNALQQSLDLEFVNARAMLINASKSLEVQKKNIELAKEIFEVTSKKYNQGVGSNTEVLNAQTALKEAQTNYYSALYDALNAKVDFDKANGSLLK